MKSSLLTLAGNPELQDRAAIFTQGHGLIIALADGAGGISGGAQAAEAFINIVSKSLLSLRTVADCNQLLMQADQQIANDSVAGETTGLIVVVTLEQVFGASAGDSEAWMFKGADRQHLTKFQNRKPFLGSGAARPMSFIDATPSGVLVAASDGLWKYTSHERVQAKINSSEIDTLPHRLANLVRLHSGGLQDDVAIAVVSID